jgi:hypothetical protein
MHSLSFWQGWRKLPYPIGVEIRIIPISASIRCHALHRGRLEVVIQGQKDVEYEATILVWCPFRTDYHRLFISWICSVRNHCENSLLLGSPLAPHLPCMSAGYPHVTVGSDHGNSDASLPEKDSRVPRGRKTGRQNSQLLGDR